MKRQTVEKICMVLFCIMLLLFEIGYNMEYIIPNFSMLPTFVIFFTTLCRFLFYIGLFIGFRKLTNYIFN